MSHMIRLSKQLNLFKSHYIHTIYIYFFYSAWARICKILGPAFAPYLPLVMAPIMKTASMKPEVALLDNDELNGVENVADD